jgi:hypothetical protein
MIGGDLLGLCLEFHPWRANDPCRHTKGWNGLFHMGIMEIGVGVCCQVWLRHLRIH